MYRGGKELTYKRHLKHSFIFLVIAGVWSYRTRLNWLEMFFILCIVVFGGVLVDIDHASPERIKKKLTGGENGPTPGWPNYLHSWPGAILLNIFVFWKLSRLYPPCSLAIPAYWLHMFMDARCREVIEHNHSPLPKFLHRYIPERWKCNYS